MMYDIAYCSQNHGTLLDAFAGFGLENPSRSGLFDNNERLRFSGWFAHEFEKEPFILIRVGAISYQYNCDVVRNDVVESFSAKGRPEVSANGFSFWFESSSCFDLYVVIGDREIKVWSVNIVDSFEQISGLLKKLHCNSSPEIANENDCTLLKKLSHKHFSFFQKKDLMELGKCHNVFSDIEAVSRFVDSISDPFWNLHAICQSLKTGRLSIEGFSSLKPLYCMGSITVDDYNYLLFSEEGVPFFIVQHLAVACIVFPTLFIVIDISVRQWCIDSLGKLTDLYSHALVESLTINVNHVKPANFTGIHISQSRPYHTIYDVLQGLFLLPNRISHIDHKNISLVVNDRMSFFSDELYSAMLSGLSMNFFHYAGKAFSAAGGFSIFPAVQYSTVKNSDVVNELGAVLVRESLADKNSPLNDSKQFDHALWIGISTEKRAWVEQVEGWTNILRSLSARYKIRVVVDGRTFPAELTDSDIYIKRCEDEIFKELSLNCPDVVFVNAIGMRAAEKIKLALDIDLFITSFATDSVYPSCIAHKPGIVYSPHQIGEQKYLHIHHDVLEIEQSLVKSSADDNGKPWHHISVSIDWREILRLIRYRLNII